jgi:ammonia channel protein AmtB
MLNLVNVILGSALLVAGRKLFWLFVAAAGFVTGMQLATRFTQTSEGLAIMIGLVIGLIFALLAIFLQRIAIAIAGFLAGGYILTALAGMLGMDTGAFVWIMYVIGGIIGVILVSLLFDWALITLSSLAGASLVVQSLFPQNATGGLIFIVLLIIGILIQGSVLRHERRIAGGD